ncbi:hypothetical protein OAN22_01850 [Alphaproteobacteria bacterium]|nr:hypothetical protein [Alphaproteobacteria bacterium]
MAQLLRILWSLLAIAILAGGVYIALFGLPAPHTQMVKTISYDQVAQKC